MDETSVTEVDVRGLRCPLPALRTLKALRRAPAGGVLNVLADDPLARIDVPNAAREAGAELLAIRPEGAGLSFLIRSAGPNSDPRA
ncbi:sulfurtransferase TusA family protein [Hansschlegelia beijingensis]|uniref:tRNA 2-thiouridine synthesizing protein A n=1 Tax=Hansschlegelia beijingensis TaxID=1133344 RepID=A0A7W6GEJ1_9HYPH|nr:sulfurtransferase TusA family protein [Hansschlegelia beijingensis]MBB3972093.1 tRNA 2-thiouridine synthesizing protein A [Hansschlegelia beijingensis]